MDLHIELNTKPHKVTVGGHELLFVPETTGAAFASAYAALKQAQKQLTDAGDNIGATELEAVGNGMREFLARFMLPESADLFATLTLPDRALVQMLEWIAERYSGKAGGQPSA